MVTKSAVKVPMKKIFAVATLVGAASGTAVALRTADASHPEQCGMRSSTIGTLTESVAERVARPPVDPVPVVIGTPSEQTVTLPVDRFAIKPLALVTGSPACGNVVNKAGYSMPCRPIQKTLIDVAVGVAISAKP